MAAYNNSNTGGTRRQNDDGAVHLYYPDARDGTKEDGVVGAAPAGLYPDAHTAAPPRNGAPYMSSAGATTATQSKDGAACLYPSVHTDAASKAFSDVRCAAQNEDAHFFELPRVPGFAVGRYPTKTTAVAVEPAAGYYNSGVVAGEVLPLASKVFVGKTTSVPAVAVGHDKVAGRLRRELPVLGLYVASLAVVGLAAGEPTPAAGFGLFLMLIVGLSTVTIRVLRD